MVCLCHCFSCNFQSLKFTEVSISHGVPEFLEHPCAKALCQDGKHLCLSLSAPYVCRYFGDRILTVPGMAGFWRSQMVRFHQSHQLTANPQNLPKVLTFGGKMREENWFTQASRKVQTVLNRIDQFDKSFMLEYIQNQNVIPRLCPVAR